MSKTRFQAQFVLPDSEAEDQSLRRDLGATTLSDAQKEALEAARQIPAVVSHATTIVLYDNGVKVSSYDMELGKNALWS